LNEDARAGSILATSVEDQFVAEIVHFDQSHQMWTSLHYRYEHIGHSTYIVAIHQDQLLR
jgi:hypothetical protein